MRPSNQKSIYALLCKNMDEVDECNAEYLDEKIQKLDALVRAGRMATDMMVTEIKRAMAEAELLDRDGIKTPVRIREIESKGFDDTTHIKENYDL